MSAGKGFTLVELLVVISIISLISSAAAASLNAARSNARDSRRLADMQQLAKALELYRDSTGAYPEWVGADQRANSCFTGGNSSDAVSQWGDALGVLVSSGFLSALPSDPRNVGEVGGANSPDYCYGYHRSTRGATFDGCRDTVTNELLSPNDYEYLLYFSMENTSKSRYKLNWNGSSNPPIYSCFIGPHR